MTGGQESHATGRLESICAGIGVAQDHIIRLNPLKKYHEENVRLLREEVAYEGVSVILAERECIQTLTRKKREVKAEKQKLNKK